MQIGSRVREVRKLPALGLEVLDLKGAIRVFARCRPLLPREKEANEVRARVRASRG